MSQISEHIDRTEDLFLNILNGEVLVDDVVILATDRILRSITTSQICTLFQNPNFEEAQENLRHQLSTQDQNNILVSALGVGRHDASSLKKSSFSSKAVSATKEQIEPQKEIEPAIPNPAHTELENITAPATEHPRTLGGASFSLGSYMRKIQDSFPALKNPKSVKKIAGGVLGIIALLIVVRFASNYESADTAALRETLTNARESLRKADEFLMQGDRSSATEYITAAKESAVTVLNSRSQDFRTDAQFLLADAEEKQLQAENAVKKTTQVRADLSVKNDNLESRGIVALGENLYAYDNANIYKTIRNIVDKDINISSRASIIAGSGRNDQNTLLFLTDTPQIVEHRDGITTPMGTEDEAWKPGTDIKTYGKYAYVLDPTQNQIWKYERRRSGYSAASPYNQSNTDLSRGISLSIDGSIYVLADDGSITRFFRGVAIDGYKFTNMPSLALSGINLRLYTDANLDFLYVLDPDNTRILIFEKGDNSARYKKQIIYDTPDVRDFVVDESGQRASLMTKDKIYEVSL